MSFRQRRLLLINACARSGTKYIHKVWQSTQLDIGHEYVGRDGSVTHFFAVDAETHPVFPWESPKGRKAHVGEQRSDFEFDHIWHQVRHPLKCITSNSLVIPRNEWEWLAPHIGIDPKHPDTRFLSMVYWLKWNQLCEAASHWTYRIEDIEQLWPHMRQLLKLEAAPFPSNVSKTLNRPKRWAKPFVDREAVKSAPDLTWSQLDEVDILVAGHIRELARHYGYEVKDGE